MEQFMDMVRAYADALGVRPSTVIQRAAKLGGSAWSKWEAGDGSPTLKTADKIVKYMEQNPAQTETETTL
ncbi:helix-turn-helix domain-containing protein [Chachezhania antarctica]|uniref:helix-turn-helix domain-containing protein n=1 Tax=Chachezhania antarctica TaxID=2340860 RepID=UPI000EB49B50|nr:helix-turn-helix transcriptional regulator [Chachezhania antarctica]|tara:strand:- start:14 stop:223 length:210 start_codon:yes stop_codon:yes gene_type:complete